MCRPGYLVYCILLFCGFSGASIITFNAIGASVQPAYYLALLWIFHRCFGKGDSKLKISVFRENKWLCIFMAMATLSIIMPLLLPDDISVINVDGEITSLSFSSSNITQLLYLWFCFVFYIFYVDHLGTIKSIEGYERNIVFFILGVSLVCIVTIYQIIAFRYDLPFDVLFRQSVHGNVQGSRIYGPCIEASILCYYLVSALPICIRWKKRKGAFAVTIAAIIIGIYSFSSTFLVGMTIWVVLEAAYRYLEHKPIFKKRNVLAFLIGSVVVCILGVIYNRYLTFAFQKILNTLGAKNQSGMERSRSFILLLNVFFCSPVFGVGFGSCRGTDLLSTWLSALGVIGIAPFLIFMIVMMDRKVDDKSIKNANIILWIVMLISVPEPYNLFVWILLADLIIQGKKMKWIIFGKRNG